MKDHDIALIKYLKDNKGCVTLKLANEGIMRLIAIIEKELLKEN